MANRRMTQTPSPPPPRPYPDWKHPDRLPCKYVGYRVFSKWVASDRSFFIVRRFGALNARVILDLQDELVRLDQELTALDEAWSRRATKNDSTNNGSFRFDPSDKRTRLVHEVLPGKLLKYSAYRPKGDTRILISPRPIHQRIFETCYTPKSRPSRC